MRAVHAAVVPRSVHLRVHLSAPPNAVSPFRLVSFARTRVGWTPARWHAASLSRLWRARTMLQLLRAVVGVALLRATNANPARVCVSKSSTVPFAKRGQAPGPAELSGICSECVRRARPARRVLTRRCTPQLPLGDVLRPRANRRHTEAAVRADENVRGIRPVRVCVAGRRVQRVRAGSRCCARWPGAYVRQLLREASRRLPGCVLCAGCGAHCCVARCAHTSGVGD